MKEIRLTTPQWEMIKHLRKYGDVPRSVLNENTLKAIWHKGFVGINPKTGKVTLTIIGKNYKL